MYLNKLNDTIELIIDNYSVAISDLDTIIQAKSQQNYVKYQEDINNIWEGFSQNFNELINDITQQREYMLYVLDLCNKYIIIYTFLLLGYDNDDIDNFMDQIIKFIENQSKYAFMKNYFNSENAIEIRKYYVIMNGIKNKKFDDKIIFDFLNLFDKNFINEYFVKSNKKVHNIIKSIIGIWIYLNKDQDTFYNLIEEIFYNKSDYIYINTIESSYQKLDMTFIDNLLTRNERAKHLNYIIMDFLEYERLNTLHTVDDKLDEISHIYIPIADDFLLYSKTSEKYEKTELKQNKENTKIRYVLNKISNIENRVIDSQHGKKMDIENINGVIINDIENNKIINKIINSPSINRENSDLLASLIDYTIYPYINFKIKSRTQYSYSPKRMMNIVRYVNFEVKQHKNNMLQTRIANDIMTINIVGLMISKDIIQCINRNKISEVDTIDTLSNNKYYLFKEDESPINVINKLYDELVIFTYNKILKKLDTVNTINDAYKIIDKMQNKYVKIRNSEFIKNILIKIYQKSNINLENIKSHEILYKEIPLPVLKNKNKEQILKIKINAENNKILNNKMEIVDGICQHNITWNDISILQNNHKEYAEELFYFIKQFVMENTDQEYICKSCGCNINIKKYVIGGTYDIENQQYISHNLPMQTNLEDNPAYEIYKQSIRLLDKIIERIASVTNIIYLTGYSAAAKTRRKSLIKNIIDMIIANNKLMHDSNRNAISNSKLFVFEFDNNVLQASNKNKDKYRDIKINNIIIYILIFIIFDLNETSINYLSTDVKYKCDYNSFVKYQHIFDKLSLKWNNKKFIDMNKNLLNYTIYLMGCKILRYKMWLGEYSTKQFENAMRDIIVTLNDILNSILENSYIATANYQYEIFRSKIHDKITNIFSNNTIFVNMTQENKENQVTTTKIKAEIYHVIGYSPVEMISGQFPLRLLSSKIYLPKFQHAKTVSTKISNLTNCPDGKFHVYYSAGEWNAFKCKLCDYIVIETPNEIFNHDLNIKVKQQLQTKFNRYWAVDKTVEKQYRHHDYVMTDFINKNMQLNVNIIINLINKIKNINGRDIIKDINLIDNKYVVMHDHLGNPLPKPIIITEKDNKILFKNNHPFFKTDVLYYNAYFNKKVIVFYDVITKNLLGYKEESKDFVYSYSVINKLQINYSIMNKLLLLGYQSQYIYNDDMKIKEIIENRALNIKKSIYYFQTILNRIVNGDKKIYTATIFNLSNKYSSLEINKIDKLFKNWNELYEMPIKIPEVDIKENMINALELNKIDTLGNALLVYLCEQLDKLLDNNKHAIEFVVEFIIEIYNIFNSDNVNIELKRFDFVLQSSIYARNVFDKTIELEYEEYDMENLQAEIENYNDDDAYDVTKDEDFNEDMDIADEYDNLKESEMN